MVALLVFFDVITNFGPGRDDNIFVDDGLPDA